MDPSPIKMTRQVDIRHYHDEYDSVERFASYYKQINYLLRCEAKNVLEIGVGVGVVSDYLKKKGINVVTADLNKSLSPYIAAALQIYLLRINL